MTKKKRVSKPKTTATIETADEFLPLDTKVHIFNVPTEKAKFDPISQTKSEILSEEADTFGGSIVAPPINFATWAFMMEINTRLNKSVSLRARNTAGLGWKVKPEKPFNEDTKPAEKVRVEAQLTKVKSILDCPNNEIPFTTLLYLYKLCHETTGNGYLEVVRNGVGKVTQINHVPSINVRVLKKSRGFVQMVGMKKVYYKKFNDQRVMDFKTGSFSRNPESVALDKRASELLHYKLHTASRSTPYGMPRWISTAKAITGNDLAAKRNVLFFENDAVPRMAVIVEGGILSAESINAIEGFLQNAKGVENSGRVMVLQAELQKRLSSGGNDKVSIRLEPLTVGMKEDASFQDYRNNNDDEVREAFGIAEVYFSMKGTSKGSADVGRQTTNEQEFEPDRVELEYFLNHTLIRAILGVDSDKPIDVKLELERPSISNPVDRVRMDTLLGDGGVLSINEIRENQNKPPFPENFEFAKLPFPVAMNLLNAGLSTLLGDLDFADVITPGGNGAGRPTSPENTGNAKSPRDNNTTTKKPVASDGGATSGGAKTPQNKKSLDSDTQNQVQLLKEALGKANIKVAELERKAKIFSELEPDDLEE